MQVLTPLCNQQAMLITPFFCGLPAVERGMKQEKWNTTSLNAFQARAEVENRELTTS